MLHFFYDGFYRDFIVLMLVTIFVGVAFSSGLAWAVDSHFGETINQMIGDHGEYDVILHVREEAKEAALRELERISEQQFPGAKLNETLTIAGQSNLFFGFPDQFKTQETFAGLPSIFNGVPGLNGYTVITEPSILIRGVHPSVRVELQERFAAVAGVKFAFRDGLNMLVLLDSIDDARSVSAEIKQSLEEYQILELRFPMGFEVDTQQIAHDVIDLLSDKLGSKKIENVSSAEYGEDLDAFLKTLVEMRSFLLSYASKVRIEAIPDVHLVVGEQIVLRGMGDVDPYVADEYADGQVIVEVTSVQGAEAEGMIIKGSIFDATDILRQDGFRMRSGGEIGHHIGQVELENERYRLAYTINESLRLLEELEELAVEASLAVANADAIMNTFQEALMQLEVLQIQMRQLSEGISQGGGQFGSEQLLVSLLVNGLMKNLAQGATGGVSDDSLDSLENLDVESMRLSLSNITEQITRVQEIDVKAIIAQIEYVRDSLPQLDDEEIGKSIRLINTYLGGQVIPGERVQLLVQNRIIDEKELEPQIREALNNPYANVYLTSVGMVNPDVRSELFRVLQEIRATIAGMLAMVFVMAVLILDHATIFSTLKWVRTNKKGPRGRLRKLCNPIIGFGGFTGMVALVSIYLFSRAEIPYMNPAIIGIIGCMMGCTIVVFAEKFSPIHSNEIMAGQALGLSDVQIMREIVIPVSRPGLLNMLNRWKQRF